MFFGCGQTGGHCEQTLKRIKFRENCTSIMLVVKLQRFYLLSSSEYKNLKCISETPVEV